MLRITSFTVVLILLCAANAPAGSKNPPKKDAHKQAASVPDKAVIHNCSSCHSLSKEEAATVLKGLGEVKEVKLSPLKGLYEVTVLQGNRQAVAYLDFSKKYIVPGPIFSIAMRQSITPPPTEIPKKISKAEFDKIPLANSIVMGKPDGKKRMFVFTDPDCPFCKRLHEELKKLVTMEPDLAIYIKMFPLKMHPGAYDKARVILGAGSVEMLDKAFAGEKLPEPGEKDKREPVDETIRLAESLGVDGTPAMILPDGRVISGFRDSATINKLITGDGK